MGRQMCWAWITLTSSVTELWLEIRLSNKRCVFFAFRVYSDFLILHTNVRTVDLFNTTNAIYYRKNMQNISKRQLAKDTSYIKEADPWIIYMPTHLSIQRNCVKSISAVLFHHKIKFSPNWKSTAHGTVLHSYICTWHSATLLYHRVLS